MIDVLIVEDEQAMIDLIRLALRNEGIQIHGANSGKQAFTFLEEQTPDLIVLDLMMPVMNGEEVFDRLQEVPTTANIPVLVITAHTSSELNEQDYWFEKGAAGYMIKPFKPAALIHKINEILNR